MNRSVDRLFQRIESKCDGLVNLTRDLVQIPTMNPPGDNYDTCTDHLNRRHARHDHGSHSRSMAAAVSEELRRWIR